MSSTDDDPSGYTRRRFLTLSIASGASAWLDKNGSHNQPAGPQLEPSHIYHFKGRVARCANVAGPFCDHRG